MSKFSTEEFIKEKTEVEEADAVRVFGKSRGLDTFDPATGRIIFIGMPGSGRLELAEQVAERLKMRVVAPEVVDSVEALDAVCADAGIVLVLPCEALRDDAIRAAVREKGKVFYLMAEVLRMAYRLNKTSIPEQEAISALFVEMEPLCMMTLHYILQAWKEPKEIVENVLEMLAIPA
jgi:shikimate kinase